MKDLSYRTYDIVLDTRRGSKIPYIKINSSDSNSIVFKIKITEKGKEQIIPVGSTILMYFIKSDGTKVVQSTIDNSIDIVDNNIVCKLKTNSIGIEEKTDVEIKIKTPRGEITSPVFFSFKVERTMICDEDITSTNEYPLLIDLIDKVENLNDINGGSFGESEIIVIKHNLNKYVSAFCNIYFDGYEINDFGEGVFGGTNLRNINLKVEHLNRNEIKIQPSDTYKDLVFKEVVVINDNEYIVVYENSKQGFYIRLI